MKESMEDTVTEDERHPEEELKVIELADVAEEILPEQLSFNAGVTNIGEAFD